MTPAPLPPGTDREALEKSFKAFAVMAFVVGVGLLVLVLEQILKRGYGNHILSWWPMPHGFIYMVYLAATVRLGLNAGWSILKMVGVMLAGCIPFLSFWVEHRVSRTVREQLAELPVRAG